MILLKESVNDFIARGDIVAGLKKSLFVNIKKYSKGLRILYLLSFFHQNQRRLNREIASQELSNLFRVESLITMTARCIQLHIQQKLRQLLLWRGVSDIKYSNHVISIQPIFNMSHCYINRKSTNSNVWTVQSTENTMLDCSI